MANHLDPEPQREGGGERDYYQGNMHYQGNSPQFPPSILKEAAASHMCTPAFLLRRKESPFLRYNLLLLKDQQIYSRIYFYEPAPTLPEHGGEVGPGS